MLLCASYFQLDSHSMMRGNRMKHCLECLICYLTLSFYLYDQLTGKIENLKIGILKEGFGLESSEEDVDKMVREAAEQLGSNCGAVVKEVSIPMHSDGN